MVDVQTVTNIALGVLLAIGVFAQQWDKRQRKERRDTAEENQRLRDYKTDSTEYILTLLAAQRAHNAAQHPDGASAMPVMPIPERLRHAIDPARELDS
ncbi:hypothetical protein GCM10027418_06750 [Mariniluteicoccus endophyticus]